MLAARVGASQLKFSPAAVSRTISEGDKGRNVGNPVTATGNHGTISTPWLARTRINSRSTTRPAR